MVEAGEARRVLVVAQGAAEGATLVATTRAMPQLWQRQQRTEKRRERTVNVGRLVNLLPLVFGFKHRPRQGGRGSRQEVSRAMAGEEPRPEASTLLLRLLATSTGSTRGRATLSCILLECVTACLFLISVCSFAYLCQPLQRVSMFCLRGRMWGGRWFKWR